MASGLLVIGPRWWLVLIAVVAVVIGPAAYYRTLNRGGAAMILGHEGITVRGYPLVPWSDIDRLRVGFIEPRSSIVQAMARVYGPTVGFMPRDGVTLPPPPGGARDRPGWAERRQRDYGTNLTVVTGIFDVSADDLIEAARRWGAVPTDDRRRRGPRGRSGAE